jgi:hypothetical protein
MWTRTPRLLIKSWEILLSLSIVLFVSKKEEICHLLSYRAPDKQIIPLVNVRQAVTKASSYIYYNVDRLNSTSSCLRRRPMNFSWVLLSFTLE